MFSICTLLLTMALTNTAISRTYLAETIKESQKSLVSGLDEDVGSAKRSLDYVLQEVGNDYCYRPPSI